MLHSQIRYFLLGFFLVIFTALITFSYLSSFKTLQHRFSIEPNHDVKAIDEGKYDDILSNYLFDEVKILCMVITYPANNVTDRQIAESWGKRCNKLIFISSNPVFDYETVVVPCSESREIQWKKIKTGFTYMYEHYINDYDWFLKADGDK